MRPNVFQRGDPHDRIAMLGRQQIRESLMPPRSDHVMVCRSPVCAPVVMPPASGPAHDLGSAKGP